MEHEFAPLWKIIASKVESKLQPFEISVGGQRFNYGGFS